MIRVCRLHVAGVLIASLLPSLAAAQDKAAVQKGSALFTSQKCTQCHSIGARGNKKGALDSIANKLKADEMRQWLVNPEAMRVKTNATRTPPMKQLNLSKDQVDALVAFLETQKSDAAAR